MGNPQTQLHGVSQFTQTNLALPGGRAVTEEGRVPVALMFWAVFAAYVVHILEEVTVNRGFVEGVRTHIWASYPATNFIIVNATLLILIACSIFAYERFGGHWIAAPLTWTIERSLNGLFHVWWCLSFQEYSPGLVTNTLFWVILYLLISNHVVSRGITRGQWVISAAAASIIEVLLIGSLWVLPGLLG